MMARTCELCNCSVPDSDAQWQQHVEGAGAADRTQAVPASCSTTKAAVHTVCCLPARLPSCLHLRCRHPAPPQRRELPRVWRAGPGGRVGV
jgi:hypothetical protein